MDTMTNQSAAPTNGGGKGSLIGSIIVVLVLVIGAAYLWLHRSPAPAPTPPETATTTEQTNNQGESGFTTAGTVTKPSSDEVSDLEAEANALSTTDLDQAATGLEATVNAQ